MKKTKQPGENISLKTKKSEDPLVMQWINAQTNLMDSIRYLIEIELHHNGVRNLQAFIPAERTFTAAAPPPPSLAAGHPPAEPTQVPAEVNLAAASTAASAADSAEQARKQEPEPPVEDDIDDDDIESWT